MGVISTLFLPLGSLHMLRITSAPPPPPPPLPCTLKLSNLLVDIKVCKSLAVIWQRLKVYLTAGEGVY